MNQFFSVMGNPIDHSLSPVIHHLFAKQTGLNLTYHKIQIDVMHFEQQVNDFFDNGGCGLNVTLPFKPRAFSLSDVATTRCLTAQAANTLWCDGKTIHADNTDGIGFVRDVTRFMDLTNKRILLLGAGGAARGIVAPLLAENPSVLMIANRTFDKALALSQEFPPAMSVRFNEICDSFDLIINATSAGLIGQYMALPPTMITANTVCYDLAYRQQGETSFVQWAREHGCIGMDGLGMLVEQAAESFFIWHKIMPETRSVLNFLVRQKRRALESRLVTP